MGFGFTTLGAYCALSSIVPSICLMIGICMLLKAFLKHIFVDLKKLNKKACKNPSQAKPLLRDIVQDFSELKELSCLVTCEFRCTFCH